MKEREEEEYAYSGSLAGPGRRRSRFTLGVVATHGYQLMMRRRRMLYWCMPVNVYARY